MGEGLGRGKELLEVTQINGLVPFIPSVKQTMLLTWVDWLIIGIIVVSSLISLMRGFLKEALSLVMWVVALLVAWMFGGALAQKFVGFLDVPSLRLILACVILFIATLLVGSLLTTLLDKLLNASGPDSIGRLLGMVFGAVRGVLLVVLAVGLLSLLPVQQDDWWKQSKLVPTFLLLADWSKAFILDFIVRR